MKRRSDDESDDQIHHHQSVQIQFISTAIVQVLFALLSIAISENEICIMWYVIHIFLGVSLWQHGDIWPASASNNQRWVHHAFRDLRSGPKEWYFVFTVFYGCSHVNWQEDLYIAILNLWLKPLVNAMCLTWNVNVFYDSSTISLVEAQELSNDVLVVSWGHINTD